MDQQFVKKPWHKTGGGIAFLIIASIILLLILIFVGFFVYYAVQIKYGDVNKLNKQFGNVGQTIEAGQLNLGEPIDNWQRYVKDYNPQTGDKDAKITIIEFVDFECPYCRSAYPVFRDVIQRYGPVLRIVFKNLPFENTHPDAKTAALAGMCAKEQNVFWQYQEALLVNQKLDEDSLLGEAKKLNLNLEMFNLCLTSEKYSKEINGDLIDAGVLNLRGTPSYLVNGHLISGAPDSKMWDKIILQVLPK